jgi:hypothetical protein
MLWLRSPVLYDAILALLVLEGALLAWRARRRSPPAIAPALVASFLAAGAGFTMALRALAAGWPTWTIALSLTVAFLAHLAHLRAIAR